jgi:hypothetical protein
MYPVAEMAIFFLGRTDSDEGGGQYAQQLVQIPLVSADENVPAAQSLQVS